MRSTKWTLALVVVGMLAACGGNNADNNDNNSTSDMAMTDDMMADMVADMTETPDDGTVTPDDMDDVDMPADMEDTDMPADMEDTDMPADMSGAMPNIVEVSDQTLVDPLKVTIARVIAEADGYIVIHEQDDDGNIVVEPAIGAAAVSAGETVDLEVTLQRLAVDGETLYAMLHSENSDNDSYDGPMVDLPVVDTTGSVIAPTFTVAIDMITPDVIVEAQTADPANVVVVRQVTAAQDGYIVIHEQNEAGMVVTEPALGFASVSAGTQDEVSITLSRPVLDGETLYAMLHTEDNGNDLYDGPTTDAPVTDGSGAVINPPFIASAGTSEPFVTVYDQTASDANEVSIRQVLYANDGFVVIHEDNGGMPGNVIGNAAVSAGVTSDLVITLDRPAIDGEVLHAMLHRDSNSDGVYDGVMIDPPVVNPDMEIVSPTFVVGSNAENAVTVMDQTPISVSTKVLIDEVYAKADGYVVIHAQDANGNLIADPPVGVANISAGITSNLEVTLTRPAVNGETLYAMLHTEDNGNGIYDGPATDAPATDSSGDVVSPAFSMTVPGTTPAIIFTVNASGSSAYVFAGIEPALYDMDIVGGVGSQNPTLTLREGWRYRFDLGSTAVAHPIKFANETMFGGNDLLIQGDGPSGSYEQDPDIAWLDLNNSVSFTVAPSTLFGGIADDLDYYECVVHPSMTGIINVISP